MSHIAWPEKPSWAERDLQGGTSILLLGEHMASQCDSCNQCAVRNGVQGDGTKPAVIRLFVACRFDPATNAALQAYQKDLSGIRWMEPENFHITLRFIGKIPVDMLDSVQQALGTVQAGSMVLSQGPLGWYSHGKRHVLYAGVEASYELSALQKQVVQSLEPVLHPRAGIFTPHISLGRAHRGQNPETPELQAYVSAMDKLPPVCLPVNSFSLIQSTLTPEGAVHKELVRYPLSK